MHQQFEFVKQLKVTAIQANGHKDYEYDDPNSQCNFWGLSAPTHTELLLMRATQSIVTYNLHPLSGFHVSFAGISMTTQPNVKLDFRRPPPTGKVFLMYIPVAIVGVGGCFLLIWPTHGTDYETAGFLASCALVLAVGGLFVWWMFTTMTPMTIEAHADGLVIIDRKSGDEHRVAWDEVSYQFIEGGHKEVTFVHVPDDFLVVDQHPKYCASPPTYLEFREALIERAHPYQRSQNADGPAV